MATTGTYDNIVTAGSASVTISSIAGTPNAYTVYDITGTVVASGSVSGSSVTIPAPGGAWPAGWTYCFLTSATWSPVTGYIVDAVQISAFRNDVAPLPPVPAAGTSPNASDANGRQMDGYLHALTVMGPQRWQINNAAAPTTYTAGTEQGGTIAAIQANVALDNGAAGYTNPGYADAARPRPQFVQLPNPQYTASGYSAGVTATVAALGPGTAYGVEFFEGLNEPMGEKGLTAAQSATQFNAFRTAVKAGSASAKAIGPCEVTYGPNGSVFNPQVSAFASFLSNITPGTLDGCSVHLYNGYNGDFLATDVWLTALRGALATAGYASDLPFFLTETGSIINNWRTYDPRRLAQWTAQLYLTAERFGIPKEHIYWFFDTTISGFGDGIKSQRGDLRPQATFWRTYSEEVYGQTYSSALDFGTVGNKFYRGNVYRAPGATCVALYAQGNPADTVTLNISDTGSITLVDWQGRTSSTTAAGGKITVPIGDLPTYVRLSAGVTVSVSDVGNGVVGATNLAPSATASSGSGAASPSRVNDGIYQTGSYLPTPDTAFISTTLPDTLTLTWGTNQTIGQVLVRQTAPWMNVIASAMTKAKLEYWNGSGWLPCPTVARAHWDALGNYNNTTASQSFFASLGVVDAVNKANAISFYDNNWCHNISFSTPVVTTRLRLTITEASYGHLPNKDSAVFGSIPGVVDLTFAKQIFVSEILALQGPAQPTTGFIG